MIIFLNSYGEIKAIGNSTDESLISYDIDESYELFPFEGWSEEKIKCYKVAVSPILIEEEIPLSDEEIAELDDSEVITKTVVKESGKYMISMMTPYLDSRYVEHLASLGYATEENSLGLMETYEETVTNSSNISDVELALEEVYEMLEV